MSLVVLNKLLVECKRDIGMFARQGMRMISTSLDVREYQTNKVDMEVVARASTCFISFTRGTDGGGIGVDDGLTAGYLEVLNKLARLATFHQQTEKPDDEEQSRVRLIALRALEGAAGSDAMFSSGGEFSSQVKIIIPALMTLLHETSIEDLQSLRERSRQGSGVKRPSISAVEGRLDRVQSLSAHVPGEKGPSTDDVSVAAFKALYDLVSQCHTAQASHVLDVVFEFLDKFGWKDVERCCWLAKALAGAMLLQSRFVVPTRLVETLVNMPDDIPPSPKHSTILAMVTSVLTSHISLVGLAVTDILSSLINVIERRVSVDQKDALLPNLVTCVSSLGTHIYYADQINDIIEETALQMATIPVTNPARQEILRVLIHCMRGVMTAADVGDEQEATAREVARSSSPASDAPNKGKSPVLEPSLPASPVEPARRDLGRRNPIAPEVWQETLPFLCESTYPVRAAYARLLLFYLQTELPRDRQPEPNIRRFCNALHAAVYTLAMSSRLGVGEPISSNPPSPTPRSSHADFKPSNEGDSPPRPAAVTFTVSEPTPLPTPLPTPQESLNRREGTRTSTPSGAATPPRKPIRGGRRVSLPFNKFQVEHPIAFDNVATPHDYTAIQHILQELHRAVPSSALLSGAPMLLALDNDAGTLIITPGDQAWVAERRRACRESCALAWRSIGQYWDNTQAVEIATSALLSLPEPFVIPSNLPRDTGVLPPPDEAVPFNRIQNEGESSNSTALVPPSIVNSFASSQNVQSATKLDAETLHSRLDSRWTVEGAIRDSVERFSSAPTEHASKLMAISNSSFQSFGRPVSRAVDVSDLRDALAGGHGHNGNASAAQSMVSNSTSPISTTAIRSPKPDTKEILKEIFKDKKRPKQAAAVSPP